MSFLTHAKTGIYITANFFPLISSSCQKQKFKNKQESVCSRMQRNVVKWRPKVETHKKKTGLLHGTTVQTAMEYNID